MTGPAFAGFAGLRRGDPACGRIGGLADGWDVWDGMGRMGTMLTNTGWTDEARAASLARRRAQAAARAAERDRMFEEQKKLTGEDFVENWYPRDGDGEGQDPHYGETTHAAPYGFVDGTRQARSEPLYDRYGRPPGSVCVVVCVPGKACGCFCGCFPSGLLPPERSTFQAARLKAGSSA